MKEGLIFENDELIYYKEGKANHAGVIQVDGAIYYISSKGKAIRGKKAVHRDRANGLLERGFYTFGEDYKLVEGSFRPVKRQRGYKLRNLRHKLKKNKTLNKIFKKKNILPAFATVCSVWLLAFLVQTAQMERGASETISADPENMTTESRKVSLPTFGDEVLLCSPAAKQLYDHEITVAEALNGEEPYQPMLFSYRLEEQSGTLLISEDKSFSEYREYTLSKDSEMLAIDNLKTGTAYHYRILVGEEVYEGTFETAKATRFVSISGIKNTRDIGGYATLDGRTVRQGLLIRGQEIDGLAEPTYFIPKDAIEEVQETFGFVYDFDLRQPSLFIGSDYQSRLGEDVGHKFYNSPMYGEIFRAAGAARVRDIFRDLADPEHYPMYFHCTYGTDRSGTIIFLLQGLLGMSEEDMIREYLLTAFSNPALADVDNMDIVIEGMQNYVGETLQEKIETYFIEVVGLTSEEIESIRSIFLE